MPRRELNEMKMVSFRLPVNLDIDLRVHLAKNRIGVQHFFTAIAEKVSAVEHQQTIPDSQFLFIHTMIERARKIEETTRSRDDDETSQEVKNGEIPG